MSLPIPAPTPTTIHRHPPISFGKLLKEIEAMPPLGKRKHPILAFVFAFLFGPVGLGLYLQSWKDFWYSFVLLIGLSLTFPWVGTLAACLFTGSYAAYRAHTSNKKAGY